MSYLIYIVEEDFDIAHIINSTLSKYPDYEVRSFYNKESFLSAFRRTRPNLIILDINLTNLKTTEFIQKIYLEQYYEEVAIIMTSSRSSYSSKIVGANKEQVEYLERPLDIMELLALVKKRYKQYKQTRILKAGNVTLFLDERLVKKEREEISLTPHEVTILSTLMKGKGDVVIREELLKSIWGADASFSTRTVDMHIKSIRRKLGDDDGRYIMTVYGKGYKIVDS